MAPQGVIRNFQPCPALRNFVSCYIVIDLNCNEPAVRLQPAFPQQYLIFYPLFAQQYSTNGNIYNQLPQELLVGPFTQPVYLSLSPMQITILVNLHPGALHRLINLPMHEILNQPFEGINGFGNEIRKVNARLSEAKTPEQMIHLIEAFLLKKLDKAKDPLPIDHTFNLLIASPQQYTIDQMAGMACVSVRQFERQFLSRIGTPPTMFIRQARFAKAYRLKRVLPQLSWTAVAYECGYFDQMHLIREFKLFTDATPSTFKSFLPAPAGVNG